MTDDGELWELLGLCVAALRAADNELTALEETEHPIPDDLAALLCEHEAMKKTLAEAPGKSREELTTMYREVYNAYHPEYEMPRSPVLPEVQAELASALEIVRRRALVDSRVADALRR